MVAINYQPGFALGGSEGAFQLHGRLVLVMTLILYPSLSLALSPEFLQLLPWKGEVYFPALESKFGHVISFSRWDVSKLDAQREAWRPLPALLLTLANGYPAQG